MWRETEIAMVILKWIRALQLYFIYTPVFISSLVLVRVNMWVK